jgi:FtsH ternary system-associated peptide
MNLQLGWISVRKTVTVGDDVTSGDHIEIAVQLLPLLDPASLAELVRQSLEQQGWSRQPDGSMTKAFGETTATLAPDATNVRLAIETSTSVEAEATATKAAPKEEAEAAAEAEARAKAEAKLEGARDAARGKLVRKNAEKILEAEPALRRDIDQAVNAATKAALKRRAASLGEIENIQETTDEDGRFGLTITVRA